MAGRSGGLWWPLADLAARLRHPYWRRRRTGHPESRLEATIGLGGKRDMVSDRRPFRTVSETRIVRRLRAEGAHSVLDVGCGAGSTLKRLEELGFEAWGITISPREQEMACHDRVLMMDVQQPVEEGPLAGRTFDAVLAIDSLEHLFDPLAGLRHVNRLLRPEGLLIAYVPHQRWTECEYHVVTYTPRQFRWLLNLSGFDLERREGRNPLSGMGSTYYARKLTDGRMVYPAVLE